MAVELVLLDTITRDVELGEVLETLEDVNVACGAAGLVVVGLTEVLVGAFKILVGFMELLRGLVKVTEG